MINLWALAPPAWLNTLHFAKNSIVSEHSQHPYTSGETATLELCYGTEDKKSFVSCQLDISSLYFIGDKWKVWSIFNTVFQILLFGLRRLQKEREISRKATGIGMLFLILIIEKTRKKRNYKHTNGTEKAAGAWFMESNVIWKWFTLEKITSSFVTCKKQAG